MANPAAIRYRAFLSYSHRDTAWSKWLHRELERFRIDRDLIGREMPAGPVPKTLRPIFRDREDFPGGPGLSDATTAALDASAALIVLCSKASARRPAVNEQVRLFRSRHPDRPVIPVVVADKAPENFPPALRFEISADGTITDRPVTVLGPDLRDSGDGKSLGLAKVIAGLTGIGTDQILRCAERTLRRRNRFWGALAGVVLLVAVATGGSAVYVWQRLKTDEALLNATLERATQLINVVVAQAEEYKMPRAATLALLSNAEGLFDRVARHGRRTPELCHRRAWMLIQFARNYQIIGDRGKQHARATATGARRLLVRLAAEKPNDIAYQRDLSVAYSEVGDVLLVQGNLDEALDSYRSGLAILERLAKADPSHADWQRDLSVSYDKIGDVLLVQGNLADALTSYRGHLAVREQLARADPTNLGWQRDLSVSYDKIGDLLVAQGNLEALDSYRKGLAIRGLLAKTDPSHEGWQHDLAVSHDKIGDFLMTQNDLAEALQSFRDSLTIRDRLTKAEPAKTGWQRDLWMSYNKVGETLGRQGDLAQALISFRRGLAVGERLAKAEPTNTSWQRDLWVSYNEIGAALVHQGNLAEALKSYRDGLAAAERLAKADHTNTGWQDDLLVSYSKVGDVLVHQRTLAEGLKVFGDGLAIGERLAAADPSNTSWQRHLWVFYNKIGEILVAQGSPDEALKSFRDGLAAAERLTKADHTNTGWRHNLWMSYNKVGDVLVHQGKLAEALEAFRSGLAIGAQLGAADPDNTEWKNNLQHNIGKIGNLADSFVLARDFARALEAADLIYFASPGTVLFHTYRARALMFLGRLDEARTLHARYRREKNVHNGKSWETLVLEDFAALRNAGLSHPLMDEIATRFRAGR